jgi:exodeoxyribonuclease V beta subunit
LSRDWGAGFAVWQHSHADEVAEAERLAYVAMTRAKSQLLLVWARCNGQQTVLQDWLFEGDPEQGAMRQLPLTVQPLPDEPGFKRWHPPSPQEQLGLGAAPAWIDRRWGRSSYSAWIASPAADAVIEQGRDQDPAPEDAIETGLERWPERGPLADFPRGAAAGDCLHRILEQLPFQPSPTADELIEAELIEAELQRAGLDPGWSTAVRQGFDQVLSTPLGGPLGDLSLQLLSPDRRLHELSFDLPVHQARTLDLVEAFRRDPEARFGSDYIPQLQTLQVNSRGFLTGSIDLVFSDAADPQQARWWVADWKSNWIGERALDGEVCRCGPRHYHDAAMQAQMLDHHYPLQAHLYLVALHRHLRWRLPGYAPERHLGGYVYVFLRGMPGAEGFEQGAPGPGRIVEPAPLQRVLALDRMLQEIEA